MKLNFDTDTIRMMTLFENMMHVHVKDCVLDPESNSVCLVIEEGMIGLAIGKNGASVKRAEQVVGRQIKMFEFSNNLVEFVKKMIPQTNSVRVRSEDDGRIVVEVHVDKKNRPLVIGRDGRNLKLYKELLKRNHKADDLIIR
ncbi:MAG: NusA-like transcription termination signal-binding factor [Candidatus Aenigmarchaeota archaeon]|nr:NusA-like transcription termination signal-binding factor [Candidatus Aenigmarchaeota archaeon]